MKTNKENIKEFGALDKNQNANWKLNKQQKPEQHMRDIAKHALHKKLNVKSYCVLL